MIHYQEIIITLKEELIKMKKQKDFQKLKPWMWISYLIITILIIFMLILIFNIWKHKDFEHLLDIKHNVATEGHTNVSTILYGEVYLESSEADIDTQPYELVKNAMSRLVSYNIGEVVLFYNGELVAGTYQEADSMDNLLLLDQYSDKCYLEEYERKDSHYIKAVSAVTLFDETYILITTTDISDLYELKDELTCKIIVLCIVCGCLLISPFLFTFRNFAKHSNIDNKL